MDSTPDTGCTITLLNLDLALRNGIHIERTKKIELYHAAGGSMHVEGMANIRVCANNIQATLRVAVSSELKENMFISCDDLRKLRVKECRNISSQNKKNGHGTVRQGSHHTGK